MKSRNNIVNVIQMLIKYYNVPINNKTAESYILNHYLFPSIEVVCEAFDEWKIDYEIYQLNKEELQNTDTPFITHIAGEESGIVFVYSLNDDKVIYFNSYRTKKTVTLDSFITKWSGLVIKAYPNEKSGEKEFRQNKQSQIISKLLIPLYLIVFGLALLPFIIKDFQTKHYFTGIVVSLIITKIIGVTASLFIVLKELKIYNKISFRLCTLVPKFDCNAILGTPASIFYGWISWGDIGVVYFLSSLFVLLVIPKFAGINILLIISIFSVFFPLYSIYYQIIKIRKICPFCMLVQIILIFEFLILSFNQKIEIPSIKYVWQLVFIFVITGLIVLLIKAFYFKEKQVKTIQKELISFKNNPNVFNTVLKQKRKIIFPANENSFFCGNHNSSIIITAFISLSCNACASVFEHLKNLFLKNNDISLNMIFSVSNADNLEIINHLYYNNQKNGNSEALIALSEWYSKTMSRAEWLKAYPIHKSYNIISHVEQLSNSLYKINYIEQIPTVFINGYKLPDIYEISNVTNLLLENISVC